MLREEKPISSDALPIAALRDHLRLGRGFADVGAEDAALEGFLRAALAVIEGRTAKVLLSRAFRLRVSGWREAACHPLPVAPVTALGELSLHAGPGAPVAADLSRVRLMQDMARPKLHAVGGSLPAIPEEGHAELTFTAGFGSWRDLPADLAQAVLLLAATYYEHRHERAAEGAAIPFGIGALIEPWRTVRLIGGGRR